MKTIPFAKPFVGQEEARAAAETVLSGWITQGPRVKEFEDRFALQVGGRHACAVCNCTAALQLALVDAGVQPGDVVLTVSHSFIATANVIRAVGAEPVFVDIDPRTLNMSPEAVQQTLNSLFHQEEAGLCYGETGRFAVPQSPFFRLKNPSGRLGAILVPHQLGMPADLGRLLPLAEKAGVPLVEDAACAIGSELQLSQGAGWEPVGRPHGYAACFSFHPRKVVTTGEGGMITTMREASDSHFRLLRHHGMSLSDSARHAAEDVVFEDYLVTAYNYRLNDIQAAVGLAQLERLPRMVDKRRHVARLYMDALGQVPELLCQHEADFARSNWQSFAVILPDPDLLKPVMRSLLQQGVSTRRGVMCAHLEPPYSPIWPAEAFPESVRARDAGLLLPMHHELEADDVQRVADALQKALQR